MAKDTLLDSLNAYINALNSLFMITHFDFEAIDKLVDSLARQNNREVFEYHNALGEIDFYTKRQKENLGDKNLLTFLCEKDEYARLPKKQDDKAAKKGIVILLKDIQDELKDNKILSLLLRIASSNRNIEHYNVCVIIAGIKVQIPQEIEHEITLIDFPNPQLDDIKGIMQEFMESYEISLEQDCIDEIALSLRGLNEFQIKRILALSYQDSGEISRKDTELISKEKRQFVKKSGMLEFIEATEDLNDLGGLNGLKDWMEQKACIIKNLDGAIKFCCDIPKGVLIVGVPGCGKSLAAKITSKIFEIPLIRLDMGALLGKYLGESERNMQRALKLTEEISPCVLWIDELEKAFSNIDSGGSHEVTTRLFGQFLTWMQEKQNVVFVVATANNIAGMPPEFLRKGRFDEIFFVDLPTEQERREIIKLHLKKRNKYNREIDLAELAKSSEGFSGADLESAIKESIELAFVNEYDITTDLIKEQIANTSPISEESVTKIKDSIKTINAKLATEIAKKPAKRINGFLFHATMGGGKNYE